MTRTVTDRITWTCEECHLPIADGAGYLECRYFEADQAHTEWDDKQRRRAAENNGVLILRGDELLAGPEPAHWTPLHSKCDPHPNDSSGYWFDVERISTPADVIDWTAHLMDKGWIGSTDWVDLLHRVHTQLTAATR